MREKKKTIIRKKRDEVEDLPPQGSPVETEAPATVTEQPAAKEEGVSAPQLHGKKRVGKGAKKFEHPTDNNQTRVVQGGGDLDEEKPELEDGEPELEE